MPPAHFKEFTRYFVSTNKGAGNVCLSGSVKVIFLNEENTTLVCATVLWENEMNEYESDVF